MVVEEDLDELWHFVGWMQLYLHQVSGPFQQQLSPARASASPQMQTSETPGGFQPNVDTYKKQIWHVMLFLSHKGVDLCVCVHQPPQIPSQRDIQRLLWQVGAWWKMFDFRFGLICIYPHLGFYKKTYILKITLETEIMLTNAIEIICSLEIEYNIMINIEKGIQKTIWFTIRCLMESIPT